VTGHKGGQGGGASPGDLKLSGVTLGAKEKVGGDKVENHKLGAELLHTNAFPPLCDTDNTLVDNPTRKAQIFQQRFFPEVPQAIQPIQEDDPPPLPTRTWAPITLSEITVALSTASDSSAPGPSSIGYQILKWAHSACPDALTHLQLFYRNRDTPVETHHGSDP
jgi:hypothetical protein